MPDLKVGIDLDTTTFQGKLQEIRSQIGMALGGATGFGGAAMAMSGTPNLGGSGFGHTFTNPQMAYTPHYGAIQAQTSLQQEAAIMSGGLSAAQQLKPPGVAPAAFAMAAMTNAIDRDVSARQEASAAARATFWTGAGGLAAGEAASAFVGAPGGALLGGMLGKRFFGAGGVGAGRMIGGLVGSFAAFDFAEKWAGGKIEEHFARVEQIGGVTKELGALAGGGRGLSRTQQYNLGVAARQAAGDLKMDVQQMGDILALGREGGMLPTSTDPSKAREQYKNFARAIEEGAQVLQTSLAGATQVIKQATQQGMTAREGITQAAGAGGADVWLAQQARMNAFGAAGASAGRQMGFTGAQGRGVFMGGLGAGAAAGMTGEEMKIMGGRFGAAAFVGQTQMAMAASPMGDMQLMAAMGGGGLPQDMMGMAGAAMSGLMSGGGDMMSNIGRFMVHKNEYRRGMGRSGIQTMARHQLEMGAEMIQRFMPDLSMNEAKRMYGISMGLNPDQAKLLAGGGGGGGGGGRGARRDAAVARATMAYAATDLGGTGQLTADQIAAKIEASPSGFGMKGAIEGAIGGAVFGAGPWGIAGGAALGFATENWGAIKGLFTGGPGLFASAEEKADYYQRKAASDYDKRIKAAEKEVGFIDTNEGAIQRFLGTDLSRARLNLDAEDISVKATAVTGGMANAMLLSGGDSGAGTLRVGGRFMDTGQMQKLASSLMEPISRKQRARGRKIGLSLLGSTAEDFGEAIAVGGQEIAFGMTREKTTITSKTGLIRAMKKSAAALRESGFDSAFAGEDFAAQYRKAMEMSPELRAAVDEGGAFGAEAITALSTFMGEDVSELRGRAARQIARAGGAALEGRERHYRGKTKDFIRAHVLRGVGDEEIMRSGVSDEAVSERAQKIIAESRVVAKTANSAPILNAGRTGRTSVISEEAAMAQARSELKQERTGSNLVFERKTEFSEALILEAEKQNLSAVLDRGNDKKSQKAWQKVYDATVASAPEKFAVFGGRAPSLTEEYEVESGAVRNWAKRGMIRAQGYMELAAAKYNEANQMQGPVAPDEGVSLGFGVRLPIRSQSAKSSQTVIDQVKEKLRDAKGEITKMVFGEELKEVTSRVGTDKRTGKARGSSPLQRAAGFGAREEAMSSINRSLRHTERMIKDSYTEVNTRLKKLEEV